MWPSREVQPHLSSDPRTLKVSLCHTNNYECIRLEIDSYICIQFQAEMVLNNIITCSCNTKMGCKVSSLSIMYTYPNMNLCGQLQYWITFVSFEVVAMANGGVPWP